jgi:hypothetical protein
MTDSLAFENGYGLSRTSIIALEADAMTFTVLTRTLVPGSRFKTCDPGSKVVLL